MHAILKALPAHLQQMQEKKEKEREKEKDKDAADKDKPKWTTRLNHYFVLDDVETDCVCLRVYLFIRYLV